MTAEVIDMNEYKKSRNKLQKITKHLIEKNDALQKEMKDLREIAQKFNKLTQEYRNLVVKYDKAKVELDALHAAAVEEYRNKY